MVLKSYGTLSKNNVKQYVPFMFQMLIAKC